MKRFDFVKIYISNKKLLKIVFTIALILFIISGNIFASTIIDAEIINIVVFYIPLFLTIIIFLVVYLMGNNKNIFTGYFIVKVLYFVVVYIYNFIFVGGVFITLILGFNMYWPLKEEVNIEKINCKIISVKRCDGRAKDNRKTIVKIDMGGGTRTVDLSWDLYKDVVYKKSIDLNVKKGSLGFYYIVNVEI